MSYPQRTSHTLTHTICSKQSLGHVHMLHSLIRNSPQSGIRASKSPLLGFRVHRIFPYDPTHHTKIQLARPIFDGRTKINSGSHPQKGEIPRSSNCCSGEFPPFGGGTPSLFWSFHRILVWRVVFSCGEWGHMGKFYVP